MKSLLRHGHKELGASLLRARPNSQTMGSRPHVKRKHQWYVRPMKSLLRHGHKELGASLLRARPNSQTMGSRPHVRRKHLMGPPTTSPDQAHRIPTPTTT
jgi:hypothetical protein